MNLQFVGLAALTTVTVLSTLPGCGDPAPPISSSGGSTVTAGAGPVGGGGTTASGGIAGTTGGSATGGQSTGGQSTGGQSTGGQSTGGQSTGGQSTGGSTPNGGGSAIPATFATVAGLVKDRTTPHSCFGGSCHDSDGNPYFHLLGADQALLSDDALYTFMKGYMTRNCGALINVANPGESGLVKVLKGTCGATPVMPLDKCYVDKGALAGDCVPAETVSAIQQWIAAGAPR